MKTKESNKTQRKPIKYEWQALNIKCMKDEFRTKKLKASEIIANQV